MKNEQVQEFKNWLTNQIVEADINANMASEKDTDAKAYFQTRSAAFNEMKLYFIILDKYPPTNHKEQEPLGKVALE